MKTDKRGKSETHMLTPGVIRQEIWPKRKMKLTKYELEYGEKSEKHGKRERKTIWPGIWQETLKNVEKEKSSV